MLKIRCNIDNIDIKAKNIIIVPELYSHNYERFLCEKYGNSATKTTEILTFKRISRLIFAEIGGFANNFLTDAGRLLVTFNAITNVFDTLKVYTKVKMEIIAQILNIIDEFKMYKIEENDLLDTAQFLEGNLKNKILDLYLIYTEYNKLTSNDIRDPRDEIDFLCKEMHKTTVLDDTNVYFDKFTGFTPQQFEFIKKLLEKHINVTIVLDIKTHNKLYDLSKNSKKTLKRLQKMCEIMNITLDEELENNKHSKFGTLCENLFEENGQKIECTDICIHISNTVQNECQYVAAKILQLIIKKNYKFSDFLITTRNFKEYENCLEMVFNTYNIPLYLIKKNEIETKLPIKFLFDILNCIEENYNVNSVFKFLKSPMSFVNFDDVLRLEDYIIRWDLRYLGEKVQFKSNPSFKLRKLSEDEEKVLAEINNIKNLSLKPIYKLEKTLKTAKNGEDFAKILYQFCIDVNLDKAIINYSSENLQIMQEIHQLWDILVDSFDQFVNISGNQNMTHKEFIKLYKILLSSYEVATIPSNLDTVSAGEFERILGEKRKVLFVLGANSDNLPKKLSENKILLDNDREKLENYDITLSPYSTQLFYNEIELIHNVFNVPEDKIFVSYAEVSKDIKAPSDIVKNIINNVKNIQITTDISEKFNFMYYSKSTALEKYAEYNQIEKITEIDNTIINADVDDKIDDKTVKNILGNTLSATKIESFNSCRFMFFMKYILSLYPRKVIKFDKLENGNFIHFILEKIPFESNDIDVKLYVQNLIDTYSDKYFANNLEQSAEFVYELDKIRKNTALIVENIVNEIKNSHFTPEYFELNIGNNPNLKPFLVDNYKILGKIDRVDILRENETLMIRIIDYKSGAKKLDLSTFLFGINMQMFIYLNSLEHSLSFDEKGNIKSTGVLYVPTKMPKISENIPVFGEKLQEKINKDLKRSGIILKDVDIACKMETNNPFMYLPAKLKIDNSFDSYSSVASQLRFDGIKNYVQNKVKSTILEMESGEFNTNPYKYGDKSPCDYCDYQKKCNFCSEYDKKREFSSLNMQEFFENIGLGGEEFE